MGSRVVPAIGEITLQAKVLRADGSVEDLGTVAYWSRNRFKRAAARLLGLGRIRVKAA